jgi:hypothetical protein
MWSSNSNIKAYQAPSSSSSSCGEVTSRRSSETRRTPLQLQWPSGAKSGQGDDLKALGDMLDGLLKDIVPSKETAATTIQAHMRGTLARWNLRVLELEKKLWDIRQLEEKQLRKIEQRKRHTKKALKQEQEYEQEHRAVRRRLRRVKTIRSHLQKEKIHALDENHNLKEQCASQCRDNGECARVLQLFINDIERGQANLDAMKATSAHLQVQCQAYQLILQVFPRL